MNFAQGEEAEKNEEKSQKARNRRRRTRNKKNENEKTEKNSISKPKKTKKTNGSTPGNTISDGIVMYNEESILKNGKAAKVISDIVDCFTAERKLPYPQLLDLKASLGKRIAWMLAFTLNNFLEKVAEKVLNELNRRKCCSHKKPTTKDASCQTDVVDAINNLI